MRNDGKGTLRRRRRAARGPTSDEKYVGRGATYGDYDNDGDWTCWCVNLERPPHGCCATTAGTENHWLKIDAKLPGGKSDAIGARVTVTSRVADPGPRPDPGDRLPVAGRPAGPFRAGLRRRRPTGRDPLARRLDADDSTTCPADQILTVVQGAERTGGAMSTRAMRFASLLVALGVLAVSAPAARGPGEAPGLRGRAGLRRVPPGPRHGRTSTATGCSVEARRGLRVAGHCPRRRRSPACQRHPRGTAGIAHLPRLPRHRRRGRGLGEGRALPHRGRRAVREVPRPGQRVHGRRHDRPRGGHEAGLRPVHEAATAWAATR